MGAFTTLVDFLLLHREAVADRKMYGHHGLRRMRGEWSHQSSAFFAVMRKSKIACTTGGRSGR